MSQDPTAKRQNRTWILWAYAAIVTAGVSISFFVRSDAWWDTVTGVLWVVTTAILAARAAYGRKRGI